MTKQQLEVRRRTAVALVEKGEMSYREAAAAVGAVPSSVSDWVNAYRAEGEGALGAKPERGRNRTSRLGEEDRTRLAELIKQGARSHGFDSDLWTLSRIQKLVADKFGVNFSISHVHRVVTDLGFTPQKPERRSREQDVEAVKEFREERWPALGKGRGTRGGRSS